MNKPDLHMMPTGDCIPVESVLLITTEVYGLWHKTYRVKVSFDDESIYESTYSDFATFADALGAAKGLCDAVNEYRRMLRAVPVVANPAATHANA